MATLSLECRRGTAEVEAEPAETAKERLEARVAELGGPRPRDLTPLEAECLAWLRDFVLPEARVLTYLQISACKGRLRPPPGSLIYAMPVARATLSRGKSRLSARAG